MPQAVTVPRFITGHSSSTVDTAGLRFELRGDWQHNAVSALYPQIQALCQRSSDPAQFSALALQSTFYPVVPTWRQRLIGVAWRTLLIFSSRQLEAVLFLREGTILGQPTGYMRGFSAKGETMIVAEAGREEYWLAVACKMLLDSRRAFLILLDRPKPTGFSHSLPAQYQLARQALPVLWQHPLQSTFDATIASLGRRTRRNLRHALLHVRKNDWHFQPELTLRELASGVDALRSTCTHPFSADVARQRLQHSATVPLPLRMGLFDAEGRWLSCIAGYRHAGVTSILWQVNARGFDKESICITMRALLLQHEIERGTRLVRFIGGTTRQMEHLCTPTESERIVLGRAGLRLALTRHLPSRILGRASNALDPNLLSSQSLLS
jgi:hypothetical protein